MEQNTPAVIRALSPISAMNGSDVASAASSQKNDRHVVTWTPQEDDLLREQIALQGENNWSSISSKFQDKTGRQCRRRWFAYLKSECNKGGGWSAEEDMLLLQAQKILGNKWTEISKRIPGRTDNAVKHRFLILSKRQAKDNELNKENNVPCAVMDSSRALLIRDRISAGIGESSVPAMQMRYNCADSGKRMRKTDSSQIIKTERNQLRRPLADGSQNAGSSMGPLFNSENLADFATPNKKSQAFHSLAIAIPTPKFSESEKKFLSSIIGMSSDGSSPKDPPCRRALQLF